MRCVCGKEVSPDREFCPNCGRPIVAQTIPIPDETQLAESVAPIKPEDSKTEKYHEEAVISEQTAVEQLPFETEQKAEDVSAQQSSNVVVKPSPKKKKKSKGFGIVVALIVLAAAAVVGWKMIRQKNSYEPQIVAEPVVIETPTPTPEPTPVPDVEIMLSELVPTATSLGGGFEFFAEGHDNHDNYYDNAIGGKVKDTGNWCEYQVLHQYKRFSGVAYLSYDCKNSKGKYTRFSVYGDDELLYESDVITAGVELQKFDIDISDVDVLKVCVHGRSYLRVSDCTLTYTPIEDYVWITPLENIADDSSALEFSDAEASSYLVGEEREYPAVNIIDGDTSTCWQESVDGMGIGEAVTLYFTQEQEIDSLSLVLGYKNYYERNGRPEKLRFDFSDGSYGYYIFDDNNQEHLIDLNRPIKTDWVEITIESAYIGSEFEDTCITEVTAFSR